MLLAGKIKAMICNPSTYTVTKQQPPFNVKALEATVWHCLQQYYPVKPDRMRRMDWYLLQEPTLHIWDKHAFEQLTYARAIIFKTLQNQGNGLSCIARWVGAPYQNVRYGIRVMNDALHLKAGDLYELWCMVQLQGAA